jgi:peptidoglycan-associated lipoprotein
MHSEIVNMNRRNRAAWSLASASVVAVAALVAGCAKKQPPAPPPAPQAAPAAAQPAGPNQDSLADAQRRAADAARAAALAAARAALTAPVYFDFERAELTAQTTAALDAKIPVLNANPGLRIRVAGNCDARGSDEYNLALGQRRAAAAKRYLTDHGVDASRIDIISYGRERPAAEGDSEDAYAKNRRDEFEITAGGDNIKPA